MLSAMLIRVGTLVLHSVMGGMAVFCLYYAGKIPNFDGAWQLFIEALKWGWFALVILYYQGKYLDQ